MQFTHVSRTSRAVAVAALMILALSLPTSLRATNMRTLFAGGTLTEWTVPTPKSGPSAMILDQSGSCCWFVEYYGNKIGHLDPSTNTFQEWPIPTASANPYSLTITSNGGPPELWGTEYGSGKLFMFSPTSGNFREYSLPRSDTGVGYVSVEPGGPQVRVWFTETINNANGELIYDPTTGNATLYEDYFPAAVGGGAYGVYAQSSSVWFAGFSAIVRWDRASQQYTMWQLPVHDSAVGRFISMDSHGQVWYTQGTTNGTSLNNFVGVLRPDSTIMEWRLPTPGADARDISINPQSQQPWIAEQSLVAGEGAIAVLGNSSGGTLFSPTQTTAPSGGTPVTISSASRVLTTTTNTVTPDNRQLLGMRGELFTEYSLESTSPQDVITDSQGNVWVSEPGANKIARLSGLNPDFALSASPTSISVPPGGSGTVTITGTSLYEYAGAPSINAMNLPVGVTLSLDQNPINISPGENASAHVTIDVGLDTTAGSRQITLEGNDGTIAHTTSILLTISNSTSSPSAKSQCLVATATFSSELSPEVELLRDFRDGVLKSRIGASFLSIFNSWYYSFSPYIANYLREHSGTREVMRGVLYPLIGSLSISSVLFSILSTYPEHATLLSGLMASSMIGAFYAGIPLGFAKRRLRFNLRLSIQLCAALLLCGLGGILVGLNFGSSALLMIASSLTVLSATCGSAALTAEAVSKLGKKSKGT
ncbi:MAG: CFI-box-CTERM domain-containing protein [Candidatus Bathyarchaeia archaeon]